MEQLHTLGNKTMADRWREDQNKGTLQFKQKAHGVSVKQDMRAMLGNMPSAEREKFMTQIIICHLYH